LFLGNPSRCGNALGAALVRVTPGARGLIAALGGVGSLPC
jgi:hypothetical protein